VSICIAGRLAIPATTYQNVGRIDIVCDNETRKGGYKQHFAVCNSPGGGDGDGDG